MSTNHKKEVIMTLTLLNLYNEAASQEWSMYDGDASTTDDMEKSLLIALNKAVTEIMYSYPFKFRERTHVFFTMPRINSYEMPYGLIMKDKNGHYCVKLNSKTLKLIENPMALEDKSGIPEGFYVRGAEIVLYPTPEEKSIVSIDYLSLAVGEDSSEEEIFALKNASDTILVPEYLEEIFKQAVISRTMLNTISSEGDENYSAYKKQSETAYRLLIKYAKGVEQDKTVKI